MPFSRKAISLRSPALSSAYFSISWNEAGGVFPDARATYCGVSVRTKGSGIGRPGAVDEAQLAAYVALYIEQFEPLRHLVLRQKVVRLQMVWDNSELFSDGTLEGDAARPSARASRWRRH